MLKSNGNLMIFILTIGVFSIINTEMGVIGILPLLAERFGVSITQAGLLISLFALAVAFSGPVMPLLFSGMDLYVTGVSDPESIDRAWPLGTGAPKGPFRLLDTVGLQTAYNIVQMYVKIPSFLAPYHFKDMAKMLKKYIDEGKLGMSAGEGFYKY